MAPEHILEVENLTVDFPETQAVKGISFAVKKGKTLGIVGESGSGKSVTALSIMRLISAPGRISAGEVRYRTKEGNEVDLRDLAEPELRRIRGNEIAMIFQEPMTSLNPLHTIERQIGAASPTSRKTALQKHSGVSGRCKPQP